MKTFPIVHVIDDDKVLQMILDENLTKQGYAVITSLDGAEGLAKITSSADAQQIVILDHQLPSLSGLEVFHKLRSEKRFHSLPVIFMSANEDIMSNEEVATLSPVAILVKPFKLGELAAVLDKLHTQ
jgi:DNA-binding response OmpR family regulator